jgi:hypothetical protein
LLPRVAQLLLHDWGKLGFHGAWRYDEHEEAHLVECLLDLVPPLEAAFERDVVFPESKRRRFALETNTHRLREGFAVAAGE